jgi:hypothetical protein
MSDKYDTTILQSKTCMNVAILCQKVLNYLVSDGRKKKTEKQELKSELCGFLVEYYRASKKQNDSNLQYSKNKVFDIT